MSSSLLLALLLVATTTAPLVPSAFDKALAGLRDAGSREGATAAFVSMGPAIASRLADAAYNETGPVQEAIVDALVRIGPAGLPELARASFPFEFAIRAIARMGDEVLPQLEEWAPLLSSNRSSLAMGALRAIGPSRALPVLQRLTRHSEQRVREAAFNILVSWNDPRVADTLFRAVDSSDVWVRRQAIQGLGMLRDPRVVDPALRYVKSDPSWSVQEVSALALGGQYEQRFRVALVSASRNAPEIMVRRTAADVLEAAPDPVAAALGHRYAVLSVGPNAQAGIGIRYTLMLLGTALSALFLLRVANPLPARTWIALAGFLSFGLVWGYFVTKINGSVERELLFLWIPGVWLVARVMGTKMSNLKDLAIPFAAAIVGALLGSVLLLILGSFTAFGSLVVGLYGWVLVPAGFILGAAIATRRFIRRREAEGAPSHDVAFTRLATVGCTSFYAGYILGWWKLWGFSADAFRTLL